MTTARRIIVPRNLDVVVASSGGVGTTFFMKFLSRTRTTNDHRDRDGFKHLPIPPLSFNPKMRFVFIYGDPVVATISIFRRRFQQWQSEKLLRFNSRLTPIRSDMSIVEYARQQTDKFLFAEQFNNWRERYLNYPTLFLRYERIWDNVRDISDFLEIPNTEMTHFPARRERSSTLHGIDKETFVNLNRMYSDFMRELDGLRDAEIRRPSDGLKTFRVLREHIYQHAIRQQVMDSLYLRFFHKRSRKGT